MPKIQKSFHLEVTVEQFLSACSIIELQEIELRIDEHIRRAKHKQRVLEQETDYDELPGDATTELTRAKVSGISFLKATTDDGYTPV